jgi:hypothetical protein
MLTASPGAHGSGVHGWISVADRALTAPISAARATDSRTAVEGAETRR